ncbi:MAG: alpha/beta hydrolase [Actinomycetota bacterium]
MSTIATQRTSFPIFILIAVFAIGVMSCSDNVQMNSDLSEEQLPLLVNEFPDMTEDEANVDSGNKEEGSNRVEPPIASDYAELDKKLDFIDDSESALSRELVGTGIQQVSIDVGAFTFDALIAGPSNGIPVILLHGFPSTNYQWRSQLVALANAGYLAFAPNQRGYSPLARPIGVTNYLADLLVKDILQIADVLDWPKFHLVGHDWGAFVAWSFGGVHPERLLSLTPISVPHPEAFAIALADPTGEQAAMSSYVDFFRQSDSEEAFLANDAELLKGIYQSANLSELEMEPYFEVLGTPDALSAALNWYRANNFSPDLLEESERRTKVPDINLPTMYIWSTDDTALGRQGAELTAQFVSNDYRYEVFEGVNHWVTEASPEKLNAALIDFISSYLPNHE